MDLVVAAFQFVMVICFFTAGCLTIWCPPLALFCFYLVYLYCPNSTPKSKSRSVVENEEEPKHEKSDNDMPEAAKILLEVVDDAKLIYDADKNVATERVYWNIIRALRRLGVTKVRARGQVFNPYVHNAIAVEDVEDDYWDNRIIKVFRDGFVYNGKVIKYSDVVVGKLRKEAE